MSSRAQWLVSLALLAALVTLAHTATSSLRHGKAPGVDDMGRPEFIATSGAQQQRSLRAALSPGSEHPILSRADPGVQDHGGFLLFRNPRVGAGGALDTAASPERGLGEYVMHKTKSFSAMAASLTGALRHYAAAATGARPGQTKTSLLDTASQRSKDLHLQAHRSEKAKRHPTVLLARDASASSDASEADSDSAAPPLLVTYLVHFAPSVQLGPKALDQFHAKTGLSLGAYFPHRSYVLVATMEQAALVREQLERDFVDWIGEMPNEAKVVSPGLHEIVVMSPQAREEARGQQPYSSGKGGRFALNVQLQPLDGGAPRTVEQLQALAALVEDFLTAHGFPATESTPAAERMLDVVHSPSFHNDLLIVRSTRSQPRALTVSEVAHLLELLSQLVEVHVIEQRVEHSDRNEIAQQLVQSGTSTRGGNGDGRSIWAKGLFGDGQIVGCADSGSDWDHCMFNGKSGSKPSSSPNASLRKTIAYVVLPGADDTDDVGGHGTHVTGSIVGNALELPADGGEIARHSGQAPGAQLYFQDIGLTGGGLDGLGDVADLGSALFEPAYAAGARIHSNSWGSSDNTYTTFAQSVDSFIWQQGGESMRNMLILVAAGNDGLKDGSVSGTVGSPATAKNILAVGASQTTNAGWLESTQLYTDWDMKQQEAREQLQDPNLVCCDSTNTAVLKYCCEQHVLDDLRNNAELYNEEDMADFSSRGPTFDGRVKPEIVAPGATIVSARSDGQLGGAEQCTTRQNALTSMSGTSMATPTLAGSAALLRQYLMEGWSTTGSKPATPPSTGVSGKREPSAALMAAMLLNGAQSLTGKIDQNNDGSTYKSLADGIYPLSVFQGFGRVTLDRSLWFSDETRYRVFREDQVHELQTGEDMDYCFTTTGSGEGTVKATMVYSDAPGQVGAGVAAVNNLDVYIGSSADDARAGNFVDKRDTLNNAESALYSVSGDAGQKVFVKVRAVNIPVSGQRYALVVSGPIDPASASSGAECTKMAAANGFASLSESNFDEAGDSDHFPLGPVVGGTVGGVGGLVILVAVAKLCYNRYRNSGTVI